MAGLGEVPIRTSENVEGSPFLRFSTQHVAVRGAASSRSQRFRNCAPTRPANSRRRRNNAAELNRSFRDLPGFCACHDFFLGLESEAKIYRTYVEHVSGGDIPCGT